MSGANETAERRKAILGRLTDLGMELAEHLQAEALAAADPEQKHRAARDFHMVARSVRQCLALELRFERERAALAREAEAEIARAAAEKRIRRRGELRYAVRQLIWNEYEGEDAEMLESALDSFLEDDPYEPPSGQSFEEELADLCLQLGLTPPGAEPRPRTPWRPPQAAEPADPPPPPAAREPDG